MASRFQPQQLISAAAADAAPIAFSPPMPRAAGFHFFTLFATPLPILSRITPPEISPRRSFQPPR